MPDIQVKKYEVWIARDSSELSDSDPTLVTILGSSEYVNSWTSVISVKEIEVEAISVPFKEKMLGHEEDSEWYDEWYEAAYKLLYNTGEMVE